MCGFPYKGQPYQSTQRQARKTIERRSFLLGCPDVWTRYTIFPAGDLSGLCEKINEILKRVVAVQVGLALWKVTAEARDRLA
jgi:hypothetical protein